MNGAVGTKKLGLLWNVRLQVYFSDGQIHTYMTVHLHAGRAAWDVVDAIKADGTNAKKTKTQPFIMFPRI